MTANVLAMVAILAAAVGEPTDGFPKPDGPATKAAAILASAESAEIDAMQSKADDAVELLGSKSPAGAMLASATNADELPAVIEQVAEMLAFEPIHEADLPLGFPTYTPVGAIEVKTYPKHRRAEADEFFTLFLHITGKKIAMTAPVRMEIEPGEGDKLKQESMAFYYGKDDLGQPGVDGKVRTVDDEGQTVVALGCRGSMNQKAIKAAHSDLEKWLKDSGYESTGKVIVMGYNSPMVPRQSNYFEVQLPVKKTGDGEKDRTR